MIPPGPLWTQAGEGMWGRTGSLGVPGEGAGAGLEVAVAGLSGLAW